jgi:hypothetical protein
MTAPPRALILTHHLFALGGSELVAIEAANALANHGAQVGIHAPFCDLDFLQNAVRQGVAVLENSAEIVLAHFDLVYCQHQVLSGVIAKQFPSLPTAKNLPYIVYNHLSGHEPFEFPGPFIEAEIADEIWCNSAETKRELVRFGDRFLDAKIVPNPAPAKFVAEPAADGAITKILSISNHLPEEVNEALDILEGRGVMIERIGLPKHARRVMPGDIKTADALISIGKSVQYALVARRPVYCYDWFGGPGWLNAKTFDAAADHNFSGRCSRSTRSPGEIADDIMTGFHNARAFARSLKDSDLQRYLWPRYIGPLLERLRCKDLATRRRLRQAIDAMPGSELPKHWKQEADLYGLVDREYGKARHHHLRGKALAAQIAQLKASQAKDLAP